MFIPDKSMHRSSEREGCLALHLEQQTFSLITDTAHLFFNYTDQSKGLYVIIPYVFEQYYTNKLHINKHRYLQKIAHKQNTKPTNRRT